MSRRSLGTFPDYLGAQRLVDTLSDHGFPVQHVAIVGSNLRLVEEVTGRQTTWRAAGGGAAAGAWWGLFVGLIFALFAPPGVFLGPILWGLVLGAIFGAIFGAVSHAVTRGQRDFSSVQQLTATSYDVLVDAALEERARDTLSKAGVGARG